MVHQPHQVAITPVSTLTNVVNLSENQTLTGQKTFSNGLNALNINLTGTTTTGDLELILYPRGTSPGHTREIEFKELAANGDHHVALKAANSIPSTYTLTLPDAAPTATAFLKSSAAGVMSWDQATYASLSIANQTFDGQNVFTHSSQYPLVLAAGNSIGFVNAASTQTTGIKAGAATTSFTTSYGITNKHRSNHM